MGFHPEHIHEKAVELVKATSDPKYLPQLAKWLEGEGYRAPSPAHHSPQRKGSVSADDATQSQIQRLTIPTLMPAAGDR